jgi:hypothetical protein
MQSTNMYGKEARKSQQKGGHIDDAGNDVM